MLTNEYSSSFNPLDRGNSNQIRTFMKKAEELLKGFNPLDRGNSNQIIEAEIKEFPQGYNGKFQSPKSGKF